MLYQFFALAAVAFYLLYRWFTSTYDFFEKRGVPYNKPWPFAGSMGKVLLKKKSLFDVVIELYNETDQKAYGVFEQRNPLLMIRDPELIKKITIKDFDHFVNHRNQFGTDTDVGPDNLVGNSVFGMRDGRWKDMRSTLSPAFTGSKMRQMFELMNQVAHEAVKSLKSSTKDENAVEMDMKDFFTRFTNDIIASTAFGIQVNSFKDRENEFITMGKDLTSFTALKGLKIMLFLSCKWLMKMVNGSLFDRKATNYFSSLVLDAMKYRKQNNIVRPDMINILMESVGMIHSDQPKPAHNRQWSEDEILAQCLIFFFAGFETSATLMCFTAHELMENEDIQERLYEEVRQVNSELEDGKLSYEKLMGMKYMDQVVSETLRKWPVSPVSDRECGKDITYNIDGKQVTIRKGDNLWLPTCGFHRDPKYFENPLKFDPERFSEENKDKIVPFTYFPFGNGQRACIGSRFALLEAKAVIFYLLRDFRFVAAKKSTIPLELKSVAFQLAPKSGFWLKLIKRDRI